MNLCGGITQITEQDLAIEFSTDEFNTPGRRTTRKSSIERRNDLSTGDIKPRSSSRGRDKILAAVKMTSATQTRSSPEMLNPVSRDDLAKLRSRQRGLKSSSILMKKLESGFNVVRVKFICALELRVR
jgi:hypothetical protein